MRIGQLLQATVLENDAGKILLSAGHRQLSAESSLSFRPGEVLTLQVRELGARPVLRVIAALQESAVALAVRTLLPRYGPTTPLLANLSLLARTPRPPLPPLISAVAATLVRKLPDVAALATPQGLKTAIQNSGILLENRLALATHTPAAASLLESDFKANLLRLVQLVRNWPGSGQTPSTPSAPPGQPAAARAQGPSPQPAPSDPATNRPPASSSSPSQATPSPATAAAEPKTPQAPPAVQTQNVQRAIETAATPPLQRPGGVSAAATSPPAGTTPGQSGSPQPAAASGLNPPPPFAGAAPIPQSPVQASIDLLNRLGHVRLDLLQQTEAALARMHLNQLVSLPREGDHRLVEWLFDIPVRRDDDIDLWSVRLHRDTDNKKAARETADANWSVQLAFDLPGLGPMQAQVNLHGERVSTYFRAERTETLPLLRDHLHELRRALLEAGLEVGDLDCRQGVTRDAGERPVDPLIDEKA